MFLTVEHGNHVPEDSNAIPDKMITSPSMLTGFVLTDDPNCKDFKTYNPGWIYFMVLASHGKYHFVGAAHWWEPDKLDDHDQTHIQNMTAYAEL